MPLLLLLPCPAFAGAWLQDEGNTLLSTQALIYQTDSYYDSGGDELSQSEFTKTELNLYAEYGWRKNVTLGTNLFVNHVEQGNDNLGIADPEFFARFVLLTSDHSVLSIQPLVKLPSWYQNAGSPRGGSEATDIELSLLFGHNLPIISPRDYIDVRAGYRERSRSLKGQYRLDASYGMYLRDDLLLVPSVRAVIATDANVQVFREDGEQDYDLYKTEINAYYALSDSQQLSFGYFTHMGGEQTGAGQGFSIGLVQRF